MKIFACFKYEVDGILSVFMIFSVFGVSIEERLKRINSAY